MRRGSARRAGLFAAILGAAALVAVVIWMLPGSGAGGRDTDLNGVTAGGGSSRGRAAGPLGGTRLRPDAGPSGAVPGRHRTQPVRLSPARVVVGEDAARAVLAGRVVSAASGLGVAGAELTFARDGSSRAAVTDRDGSFAYATAEAGRHVLAVVTAEGHLPFAPAWGHSPITFDARPGLRVEGVVIYLTPAIEYLGLVVDAEGEPVPGTPVRILDARAREGTLIPLEDRFVTDGSGEFRFRAPDSAVLEARHPERGVGRAILDFAAQVSHRLVIRLEPGSARPAADRRIAGRVLDPAGEPVEGALVSAHPQVDNPARPGAGSHPSSQDLSGPQGRFVLSGLDPMAHQVVAEREGFASTGVDGVEAGEEDVTLQLAAEAVLRGVVLGAGDRTPQPAFAVVVERARGPLERQLVEAVSTYAADGRFEVHGLSPGPYLVRATALGHAPSEEHAVSLPHPPAQADELTLLLGAGGRIAGTVRSEGDGPPLAAARVTLEGRLGGGDSAVPLMATVLTAADGAYELAGVPAGEQSLMVAASGHHARLFGGLVVSSGRTLRADVALAPTEEGEAPRIELAGIGVVLAARDDALVIGRLVEGGGAAEAGLVPGDGILAVEGVPVTELGFQGSVQRIRGPEGSTVRLRIRREDGEEEDVVVPRRRIRA